jgi:hypothetical protein
MPFCRHRGFEGRWEFVSEDSLNVLLARTFAIGSGRNWIARVWQLLILAKLDWDWFETVNVEKAFSLIEECAIARAENLQQNAKEVVIAVFSQCAIDPFGLFIDQFIRKIDVFDLTMFEARLSFLAHVFEHTPSKWTASFVHLTILLSEILTLFVLPSRIMTDIFRVLSILCSSFDKSINPFQFVKPALSIIETSYEEFAGEPIGIKQPNDFESSVQLQLAFELVRIDTNLASNPAASHTTILSCCQAAFSLLFRLPWKDFSSRAKVCKYLFVLSLKLMTLFAPLVNSLICSLVGADLLPPASIDIFLKDSLKYSVGSVAIFSLCQFIGAYSEKIAGSDVLKYETDDFTTSLHLLFPFCRNLDLMSVLAVRQFFSLNQIELGQQVWLKVIHPSQRERLIHPDVSTLEEADSPVLDSRGVDSDSLVSNLVAPKLPIRSLSPFFLKRIPIPDELFQVALVISFCRFSEYQLSQEQWEILLQKAISSGHIECIREVLKRAIPKDISCDLRSYLDLPAFKSPLLFPATFRLLTEKFEKVEELTEVEMNYFKLFTGDDLIDFILRSVDQINRSKLIEFLRFDLRYFADRVMKMKRLKRVQIENLIYLVGVVNFPADGIFWFLITILLANLKSARKRQLSRRLISVFLQLNVSNAEIVARALTVLESNIPSNIDILRSSSSSDILEHYYGITIIVNASNCQQPLSLLMKVFPGTTVYGGYLNLLTSIPTVEMISYFLSFSVPSVNLLPFRFFAVKVPALTPAILDVLLEFKPVKTSNSQIIILQFIKRFVSRNLVSRDFTIQSKVAVYQYLHQNVDKSVNSGMLLEVVQLELQFLPIFLNKSPEIRSLLESTERLFVTSIVPSEACDILFQCCTKLREYQHAMTVLSTFLKSNSGYKSHLLTEQVAGYALRISAFSQNDSDDDNINYGNRRSVNLCLSHVRCLRHAQEEGKR